MKKPHWTPKEEWTITVYWWIGDHLLATMLKGRSVRAICDKRERMGFLVKKGYKLRDLRILKDELNRHTYADIASDMDRTPGALKTAHYRYELPPSPPGWAKAVNA